MAHANAVREIWRPETKADREAVLQELKEVLASPQFCNSKRYPALLRYVVEHTLAGRGDNLKERTLGVEVFGRPATYDTSLDTVVRYTAGEIRKRLSLYYHEEGRNARIQIHLPAGSYVPEFVCAVPETDGTEAGSEQSRATEMLLAGLPQDAAAFLQSPVPAHVLAHPSLLEREQPGRSPAKRWAPWVMVFMLLTVIAVSLAYKLGWPHRTTPVEEFWGPVVHGPGKTLVCLGGVVFQPNKYSGVTTAGKDIEYPFVSMQIAASLPRITQVLGRQSDGYEVQSSAATPITQMRDRSVVLLGGYNNEWTMRMLHPLRYQFSNEPVESISDRQNPQVQWSRDKSLPYSTADDYALVARFRDASTDGIVVVLAGLGRNGSEAAAQFATSQHYMQVVRDRVGADLKNKNIEVVLKVNVIDGKTGAPSILAVYVW